jgi:hypothetical protein
MEHLPCFDLTCLMIPDSNMPSKQNGQLTI